MSYKLIHMDKDYSCKNEFNNDNSIPEKHFNEKNINQDEEKIDYKDNALISKKNDMMNNLKNRNELNEINSVKKELNNIESSTDIINKNDEQIKINKETIDNTMKKEKKKFFEQTSFSMNFLSQKNVYKIKKEIHFSIIEIDYGDDFSYLSKIKPKGLQNLGGCCYLNSTLQCLYHIKEFTDYFFKNRKLIQKKNGLISTGLLDTFEGLSKQNSNYYYSPKKFLKNLIEKDDSFKGSDGNDSGDLIFTILSACQEELGKDSEPQDMSLDQRQENLIFSDIFHKNLETPSIIIDLFSFYLRIKNICFECGTIYYSINLENFIVFNLEKVFRMNSQEITIKSKNRVVSVDNCLSFFSFDNSSFSSKKLLCKYCNKYSNKFTVKSFVTLPKYLIMVMYRGKNEEFECKVDFKENLDLKESYYNIIGVPREKSTKYSLFGGTILYGSGGYGHTVAFCKHFDNKYYMFNDTSTREIDFDEIHKQKIYLLIYKKN